MGETATRRMSGSDRGQAPPPERTRFRVGLVLPSSNSVLEWEFARRLPRWSSLHSARMFHTEADFASLERTHDALPAAARMIATVRPHVMVIGCTAVSGLDQNKFEDGMVRDIAAEVQAPVITVLPTVIEWLRNAECRRIVLITPHGADIDAVLVDALEKRGILVRETHSMEIRDNFELGQVSVPRIEHFIAERLSRPLDHGDALFLSCTNFRSAEALPALRRRYGPRVISSTQAVVDRTLTTLATLRTGETRVRAPVRTQRRH
jgi:maleate isomerase